MQIELWKNEGITTNSSTSPTQRQQKHYTTNFNKIQGFSTASLDKYYLQQYRYIKYRLHINQHRGRKMSAFKLNDNLYWVGIQDKELRVFDVVMHTEHGTSYNSYLLKTENHTVLFETIKEKNFPAFMDNLLEVCDPSQIDYIIIDHTEPDHAGSLEKLLAIAPKAKVLASAIAHNFLKDICNRRIPGEAVTDNQTLKLDNFTLRFISVPFLHWPDSIYTYIEEMQTLVSCDSFGAHFADDRVCNDLITEDFISAFRYYFFMIMGPFKKHVQYALGRIKELPLKMICPGHGPVLRQNLSYYLNLYDQWSKVVPAIKREKPLVVNAFVSAYGYTAAIGEEIIAGIADIMDVDVKSFDMVYAGAADVTAMMAEADGILAGSCTINGDVLPPVMNLLMNLNGIQHGGKIAGAYGSYGWSGEAAEMLTARMRLLRMNVVEPPCRIVFKPSVKKLEQARKYGQRFGKKLREKWEAQVDGTTGKLYWKCTVCGEVFEGALPPSFCPVCGAGPEAFIEFTPECVSFHQDTPMRAVIIGSGIAAVSIAKAIRARNQEAQIDIYTRETILPYHRPMLPKGFLSNTPDRIFYIEPEDFYRDNRINIHLGQNVISIDPAGHRLQLEDGTSVDYDKLALATGARCFVPPIQGNTIPGVHTLREKADLDLLKSRVRGQGKKNIVIIGGGLLGLECAHYLAPLDHQITIVENCPCLLPRQLDPEGGAMLQQIIAAQKNIRFVNGVCVEEILGKEKVNSVRTTGGEQIACDLVIVSAGVAANKSLAEEAGLATARAITVNERMQTTNMDIYAAGDCAICNQRYDGIWETAMEQGNVAGANIAGDNLDYRPKVFGATLHAFGTQLFSVGIIPPPDDHAVQIISACNEPEQTYMKLFFKNNILCGGILLGDVKLTRPLLTGVSCGFSIEEAREQKLIAPE